MHSWEKEVAGLPEFSFDTAPIEELESSVRERGFAARDPVHVAIDRRRPHTAAPHQSGGSLIMRRTHHSCIIVALLLGILAAVGNANAATYFGPTPYLSVADSPFVVTPGFVLEDFEDGALNIPGVSASSGFVLPPGSITDSVDADDGVIDGSGTSGHSYNQGTTAGGSLSLSFFFDAGVLGGLPRHVGLVWTDDLANVSFEAFDSGGSSLGSIGPFSLGDPFATGQTAEDRFFGVSNSTGISKVIMSHDGRGM